MEPVLTSHTCELISPKATEGFKFLWPSVGNINVFPVCPRKWRHGILAFEKISTFKPTVYYRKDISPCPCIRYAIHHPPLSQADSIFLVYSGHIITQLYLFIYHNIDLVQIGTW